MHLIYNKNPLRVFQGHDLLHLSIFTFTCTKEIGNFCQEDILLAILLYEQFIHHTQINLCPKMQVFSTQQHAYQSFSTSRFDSICIVVAHRVKFRL